MSARLGALVASRCGSHHYLLPMRMDPRKALLPQNLVDAVHGDLRAFSRMQGQSHRDIEQARASLGELVVTAQDVSKVLEVLLKHQVSPEQAQSWAFFIRHGFLGYWQSQPVTEQAPPDGGLPGYRLVRVHQAVPLGHDGLIRGIDIDFDASMEDSIADTVARLDEIGTSTDGNITGDEIIELLHNLADTSGQGQTN